MRLFDFIPHSSPAPTSCPRRRPGYPHRCAQLFILTATKYQAILPDFLPYLAYTRLRNLLHRLTCNHVHLTDIEKAFPPDKIIVVPAAEGTAQVAQPFVHSGRRRALLIGISYRGGLLNTHQDDDRYRNVLIGTQAALHP